MTDTEIIIAIERVRGYTCGINPISGNVFRMVIDEKGVSRFGQRSPDYLNDLNAMHEAEKVLTTAQQWEAYFDALADVNADSHVIHSTARQRAEAFLRTLNLWIE